MLNVRGTSSKWEATIDCIVQRLCWSCSPSIDWKNDFRVDLDLDHVLHSLASHRLINGVEGSHYSLPPILLDSSHKLGVDGRVSGLLQLAHQGPGLVPHEQRSILIHLLTCYCAYHTFPFSKGRFYFDHKMVLLLDSSRI